MKDKGLSVKYSVEFEAFVYFSFKAKVGLSRFAESRIE
jgi:hypothetical protein